MNDRGDDPYDWEQFKVENQPNEGIKRPRRGGQTEWHPDDYADTSGHKADPKPVVMKIRRRLARLGVELEEGEVPPKQWDWSSERDRERVKELLEENSESSWTSDESLLPGFGERGFAETAQEDCGEKHPHVCCDCGQHVDFGRTCGQSVCSRCGVAWCRDLATKKVAKLRQFRMEKEEYTTNGAGENDDEWQKFHHQVINPPLSWYYHLAKAGYSISEAQDETKKIVKAILEEMRCQGLVVRHSYRGRDEDGDLHEESDDRGFWKEVLFKGEDFYGTDGVRERLAWRPHYHMIVVNDWARGGGFTEAIEKYTGWLIARIARDDGRSMDSDGAMADGVTYCLSHGDIDVYDGRNNQSANWEVGSFYGLLPPGEGGPLRSTEKFSPSPGNLEWAAARVRKSAVEVLGLPDTTTDCGADLPPVDDPDELAEDVLEQLTEMYEELYPGDAGDAPTARDVPNDVVLNHIAEGNIQVDFNDSSGGWDVSIRDSWTSADLLTGRAGSLPSPRSATASGGSAPDREDVDAGAGDLEADDVDEENKPDLSDEDDGDQDGAEEEERRCSGKFIPLEVARQRGLLEDPDWLESAPHADQALKVHQEHDELDAWKYSSPIWDGVSG